MSLLEKHKSKDVSLSPVQYGPLEEAGHLSAGLDYYKATMSQLEYEKHAEAEVTFTFHNRGHNCLADYVEPAQLQQRLDYFQHKGWDKNELDFLATQLGVDGERLFSDDFLDYLATNELPPALVALDEQNNDIQITTTGDWPLVTFWETVAMSEANELYFENYVRKNGLDLVAIYEEGDRRLSEKIDMLQSRPDIKFADFGTRRRFSLRWQKHVVGRLINECPDNFIGTSNIDLARVFNVWPIGTFAHEMPMVYAGLADIGGTDIRASHGEFLDDWSDRYGENLSTALTDTFGSDFFFSDFTPEQAEQWKSLRHDSGDPIEFGDKAIRFYEQRGIDPKIKTIVFSDGLDIEQIIVLANYFKGKINVVFGWGTTLTNDLGLEANNFVMKATRVLDPETGQSADLVKLSDVAGKHTGPAIQLERYQDVFGNS